MKTKTFNTTLLWVSILLMLLLFLNPIQIKAQGVNAPEASSFEPVDATDMVNLVTGNLSYVIPLLNVPSPEGGYPIALSYHGGIAVDQEASWVGLGWNINPGAINRGVNGYPDDWGLTSFNEFFYDKGWTDHYYSISAGVGLGNGISAGLGLSWGSNQSLGGYVSASIGLGNRDAATGMGFSVGTNGVSINAGTHGFSASLGTSGVGIGYAHKNSGLGVRLNHNPSNGLSGGFSAYGKVGRNSSKASSLGINFSANGTSINGSVNGFGAQANLTTNSNGGSYNVTASSTGFNIPIFMFYIGWSHTKVTQSLFKYKNVHTSGILYPTEANKSKSGQVVQFSDKMEENYFMDVNVMQPFSQNSLYDDLIDDAKKNNSNNLILPNYDNYTVNAQGLSGTISPYNYKELVLAARGKQEENRDNEQVTYLNNSTNFNAAITSLTGRNTNQLAKTYFTFSNAYNSYLRLKRTNFIRTSQHSATAESLLEDYITNDDTSNGLRYRNRKKEGNYITTYTNKEIRAGNLIGFIEAKEGNHFLDRTNHTVFLDKGIGAYKITSMDGKTYHYSLPVYQLESTFKSYNNKKANGDLTTSENENFFEINKTTPYATHWLLTAITGPDYYDKNENGKVDEADYGYWVEFDYGKWSDGFIWQTPNGRHEEVADIDDSSKKTYSYSWGRKQIYYLDAIKTRTHTALFVKELRKDNYGVPKQIGNYNPENQRLTGNSYQTFEKSNPIRTAFVAGTTPLYNWEGKATKVTTQIVEYRYAIGHLYYAAKEKSLRLKKILLIKNKNLPPSIKSLGTLLSTETGKQSFSRFYLDLTQFVLSKYYGNYSFNPLILKSFEQHQHQNILDVADIANLSLEQQAVQVIDFEHDYSLAKSCPNAALASGRLTLKALNFKGKLGVQVIPPYRFYYKDAYINYNKNDIDAWGYHKTNPAVWSLNKIITPTGGEIKITYGKDSYLKEAACLNVKEFTNFSAIELGDRTLKYFFKNPATIASNYFELNKFYKIRYTDLINIKNLRTARRFWGTDNIKINRQEDYQVTSLGTNWVEFDIGNTDFKETIGSNDFVVYGRNKNFDQPTVGGGITTTSITINDGIKDVATTTYNYKNGITSYAPSKEPKGIPYVSELPAPMVLYSEVTMSTKDGNGKHLGSTVYEFETLEPRKEETGYLFSLGEAFRVKLNQNATFENRKVFTNKYTIESKLGNIGRIKTIRSYNSEAHLINKTTNFYKSNLEAAGEIGVTQESFKSYKRVLKNNVETFYVSATSKINYPSVLNKVTVNQGGFEVSNSFDKYDCLTGKVLETSTYGSDGSVFKNTITPAYTKYYGMGSKVEDMNNKNMLTQQAMTTTYLKQGNNWKEIAAKITTWNNTWNYLDDRGNNEALAAQGLAVWRKHKSYVWKGITDSNGVYTNFTGEDDGFNWGVGSATANTSNWQQVSEVTKYDHYSMALENKDINGNYVATKMGDNHSKVIAVSNAPYLDMYYSGAEYVVKNAKGTATDYFDGEVKFSGTQEQASAASDAHTGNYFLRTSQGQNAFEVAIPERLGRNTDKQKRFKVSVWVRTSQKDKVSISVNNTPQDFNTNETMVAGGWTLLNGYITIGQMGAKVAVTSTNGTVDLDDFRLHPIASSITSYVYNEFDEVTHITGANGLSTCYKYDAAGRLEQVLTEVLDNTSKGIVGGFKRVSKNNYHYKN